MGESSACLLRSFSQPSPTSQESPEGDPIRRALTSSVSFGRFVSESLAWEKWSSFSQNRYLEEAEKYSKPGSVAEKKAYFEAHYKKIAAKKAAALLEQQSAAVDDISMVNMKNENDDIPSIDIEPVQDCEHMKIEELQGKNTVNTSVISPVDVNQQSLPTEMTTESIQTEGADQAIEHPIFVENKVETANQLEVSVTIHDDQEMKAPSKDASIMGGSASSNKKETAFSPGKSSKHNQESKIQSSVKPNIPIYPRKGDHVINPFNKKTASGQFFEKKRSATKSLHMSINFTSRVFYPNKTSSPVSQKIDDSRLFKIVARASKESSNQQKTPTRASIGGISKHLSVIPQLEKGRTKTLLDCSTSQITSRDSKSKSPVMHISIAKTTCGSKAPTTVSSSFSLRSEERAAKRREAKSKTQFQLFYLPFNLISFIILLRLMICSFARLLLQFFHKLEQKLNMTETEKEQHQSRNEGKAMGDSIHMCRSVSSKSKASKVLLPSGKPSASIAMKKISTLSCSPKIERKQTSDVHDSNSRPPWRLSMKTSLNDSCRDVVGKNLRPPTYSAKVVPKKYMHENTSPNIQL